jgi:hypothetical protein
MTASNGHIADIVEGIVESTNDRGVKVGGEDYKPLLELARRRCLARHYDESGVRPPLRSGSHIGMSGAVVIKLSANAQIAE